MALSVFDLFKVGIGPSSSHTVGPMNAARLFAFEMDQRGLLSKCKRIKAELFGSLGATGAGHGSPKAIILGLKGKEPATIEVDQIEEQVKQVYQKRVLDLIGHYPVTFNYREDLILHRNQSLPFHPNGMRFTIYDEWAKVLDTRLYYSVGGGFVLDEILSSRNPLVQVSTEVRYPFTTGEELLAQCRDTGFSIGEVMFANERTWRTDEEISQALRTIWAVMDACISRGCKTEGVMPGGLQVKRRAAKLYQQLNSSTKSLADGSLNTLDWVALYALAVNEENAAGGRIVTAPTNGAAGIIPAVMKYYLHHCVGASSKNIDTFFLTAGAIGILYKINASISGAEVGCQGEVGAACSMAAGALTEVLGGSPSQVENAAEIAMEHNLGLTCDPVAGLVQVPCIERNAMGAVKAISASRMALRGDGDHFVSLDQVIKTMRDTGLDMQEKYKETARGGLAVNVVKVPVNLIEC